MKRSIVLTNYTSEVYQIFKQKNLPNLHKLFQGIQENEITSQLTQRGQHYSDAPNYK